MGSRGPSPISVDGWMRSSAEVVVRWCHSFEVLTLSSGTHPGVKVEGDALKIGGQTVRFDGKAITLGVFEAAK